MNKLTDKEILYILKGVYVGMVKENQHMPPDKTMYIESSEIDIYLTANQMIKLGNTINE